MIKNYCPGLNDSDKFFLPSSCKFENGINIFEKVKPEVCAWYEGLTFIEALDNIYKNVMQ